MKNKLLRISITFLTIFLLVLNMCPISAFADEIVYHPIPMQKPSVSEYGGYVELLFRNNSTGAEFVRVVSWCFTPISSSPDNAFISKPQFHLVRNNSQFRIGYESNTGVYGQISFTDCTSSQIVYSTFTVYDTEAITYFNVNYGSTYSLVGVHYYGEFSSLSFPSNYSDKSFYVVYGESNVVCLGLNEVINALYLLIESNSSDLEYDYSSALQDILDSLNSLNLNSSDFFSDYLVEFQGLLDLIDDVLSKIDVTNEWLKEIFYFLETWIIDIDNLLQELYFIEADSNTKLYEIKDTLDAILAILNAGKDKPTLQTPNDSIDSAFGDVSGWFGDIDGFGNQLEQNRQENQQNLAQAGNIISGFFSICPPQIIIALALCAIMIVVVKVIGR